MVEDAHFQEDSNITDLAPYAQNKGMQRGTGVIVVSHNLANWLRNPLTGASPKRLKYLYAPRTSESSFSNRIRIVWSDNEPIA